MQSNVLFDKVNMGILLRKFIHLHKEKHFRDRHILNMLNLKSSSVFDELEYLIVAYLATLNLHNKYNSQECLWECSVFFKIFELKKKYKTL